MSTIPEQITRIIVSLRTFRVEILGMRSVNPDIGLQLDCIEADLESLRLRILETDEYLSGFTGGISGSIGIMRQNLKLLPNPLADLHYFLGKICIDLLLLKSVVIPERQKKASKRL